MAGMYLGEIVRLILLDMCKEGIVFTDDALPILETPGNYRNKLQRLNKNIESFGTHMVSQIVDNQPRHFAAVQNILACADIGAIRRDCEIVHMVFTSKIFGSLYIFRYAMRSLAELLTCAPLEFPPSQ